MAASKKLLCVSYHSTIPQNTGANVRIRNILQHMRGFDIVLLAPEPMDGGFEHRIFQPRTFGPQWRKVLKINPAILGCHGPAVFRRAMAALQGEQVDAVQCEHLWTYPLAHRLARALKVPLVMIEHNIETIYAERVYPIPSIARFIALYEGRALHRSDRIVVCSDIDKAYVQERFRQPEEKIWVVPNGIGAILNGTPAATPLPAPMQGKKLVLFVGKTDYYPNAEAIRIIRDELAPRLLARDRNLLYVIAGGPRPADYSTVNAGYVFTGFVDDLQSMLQHATVCCAPLASGSGTRLKIIEYAAHARPIVATSIAAEGLRYRHQEEIVIADDWDAFTDAIVAISTGKVDGQRLGRQALAMTKETYLWSSIAGQYAEKLHDYLQRKR